MTAALTCIFGDISDTYNDCGCTAAAVALRTLREELLLPTAKSKLHYSLFIILFNHATPPLEKRALRNPEIFPRGPSVHDRFKQQL